MHSTGDTLNKINPEFLEQSARALIGLMRTLADE
jgi:hypothetical protein